MEKPYPVPVLIVYAFVNRYYILDFQPDKSVDYYGIVPGDLLNAGSLLTDPFRLMIDKYVGLFEGIDLESDNE